MRRSFVVPGLMLATAGLLIAHFEVQTRATRVVVARAQRCLIGEPLGPGEAGLSRLQRVAAAERDAGPEGWPGRCVPLLTEVAQSKAAPPQLASLAREALRASDQDRMMRAHNLLDPGALERLGALLEAAQPFIAGARADDTPAPRPPVAPLLDREEAAVRGRCRGHASFNPYDLDPQPLDRALFVAGLDAGASSAPRLCQVVGGAAGPLSAVRCGPHPEALLGMAQVGSGAAEKPIFAGVNELRSAGGELLAATLPGRASPERVYAAASGATVKLYDPAVGASRGGARWGKGERALDLDAPSTAMIAAGHLLWPVEGALVARRLLDDEPGAGPELRVAAAPDGGQPTTRGLRACRHEGGWVVVVPAGDEARPDRLLVHFVDGAGWSAPGLLRRSGAAGEPGDWTLSCRPGEARLGWVSSQLAAPGDRSELTLARCTPAGCDVKTATLAGLGLDRPPPGLSPVPRVSPPTLVPLGAAVALLWPQAGFWRARVAPLDALASAPTLALVAPSAAVAADIAQPLTRGDVALLMLRSRGAMPSYFYPFRLAPDGIRPLDCPLAASE